MVVIVGFSAWLRLAAAGLGCVDWPACYGPPEGARTTPAWAMAVHRAAAMLFSVGMLWLLWRAWHMRRQAPAMLRNAAIAFALMLALTVLGLYTPMPRFPLVTLANVCGGMLLFALLGWIYFRAARGEPATVSHLHPWARGALAVVAVQIALGAWVSANYAAAACTGFMDCSMDFAAGAEAFNPLRRLAESGAALTAGAPAQLIQGTHRLGAVAAFLYIGVLALAAARGGGALRRAGMAVAALVLAQPALGLAAVLSGLPLWLVTAHNAGAMGLLLALVYLNHLLTPK